MPEDTISFTLEPDAASREPELPGEMRKAFEDRPQLEKEVARAQRRDPRQVLRYIEQARTHETLVKRCWLFLDRLEESGKTERRLISPLVFARVIPKTAWRVPRH